jgi:cytochrome c oxidase accessory protein FixG
MLDRDSLIIGYDRNRGEPRGKMRKPAAGGNGEITLPQLGDCIDCSMCVVTCPTGIDIRDGLQMECIGCAQCIDACDAVMTKVSRATGLIRYSSQSALEHGRRRFLRPRVVLYPTLLLIIVAAFLIALSSREPVDITILRSGNDAYASSPDGNIANELRVKLVNRSQEFRSFAIGVAGIAGASVTGDNHDIALEPGATHTAVVSVHAPRTAFEFGKATIEVVVSDQLGFTMSMRYRLQGPWNSGSTPAMIESEATP